MPHELIIAPSGHLALMERSSASEAGAKLSRSIIAAFAEGSSRGLLHLATNELQSHLPAPLEFVRLDALVRAEIGQHAGGTKAYLSEKNPLWRFVGRVTEIASPGERISW